MSEQNIISADLSREKSTENIFFSLIEVLRKELDIYGELKNLVMTEKNILARHSVDEINENNSRLENIVLKARMLEEVRANIVKKLTRIMGLENDEVHLMTLAESAPDEQRQKIEDLRGKLAMIAREIRVFNEINKDFVGLSMASVNGSLEFIGSLLSQSQVYSGNGKIKSSPRNGKYLATDC